MNSKLAGQHRDFQPQMLDADLLDDLRQLVRLAVREDLERWVDLTTVALVPTGTKGSASIIARSPGNAAGVALITSIVDEMDGALEVETFVEDGDTFTPKTKLATLRGDTRDLLTCERVILNFLGRLCGIATLSASFVQKVSGTKARLYDTRKTTPGWRRLEKYATRMGGAHNHRTGLYDAILIKDNHLACRASATGELLSPDAAIREARALLASKAYPGLESRIVEIEVDCIEQLESALRETPDIVLLDNMTNDELRACVALRDRMAPEVELEASGGVRLDTIAGIAATGVDRISVGALTHSAINLDLGLDWDLS